MQAQADYLFSLAEPFINKKISGFAYVSELLLSCALVWRDVPGKLARVREALKVMTHEVPTPGTDHLGEVTLIGDFAGTGETVFQNRTSIPHLWEGALLYLALVAAYQPEWIDFASVPFSW